MPLADIIRNAVKTADGFLQDIQPAVTYYKYLSETGYGDRTYESPRTYHAVVEARRTQVRNPAGQVVDVKAKVTFTSTDKPDVDPKDKIILPDGTTGPIVMEDGGVIDPYTTRPFVSEVWIGV